MVKVLAILTAVLLLLCSSVSFGEESATIPPVPPGDDIIRPLQKGAPAPFAGQLFSPETALRWGNWLTQYRYRLTIDVKRERALCAIEQEHSKELLRIEKQRALAVESSLTEHLRSSEVKRQALEERLRNPPWYQSIELGMVIGAVSTVAVLAVSIWALEARG